MVAVLLIPIVVAQLCASQQFNSSSLHILVVLSSKEEREHFSHISTKKTYVFPGAIQAAQDINKRPDLLPQFQIVPVLIPVPECDPVKGIHSLFAALLDPALNVAGVTGMFCDGVASQYPRLIHHIVKNVPQILGSHSHHFKSYPTISYILPSTEDIAAAVTAILNGFNWTRVSIVRMDYSYKYLGFNYGEAAKKLKSANNPAIKVVNEYMQIGEVFNISRFLKQVRSGDANILIILVPPRTADAIIKEAYKEGLLWPEYVWIFIYLESLFISFSPKWDNILTISFRHPHPTYPPHKRDLSLSVHRAILYDSMLAISFLIHKSITLPTNNSSIPGHHPNRINTNLGNDNYDFSFRGQSGRVNLTERGRWLKLHIKVIKNTTGLIVGRYSLNTGNLTLNKTLLQPIPPDYLEIRLLPKPLVVSIIVYGWIIAVHGLIIISFILFVIFHKEKEVKASSFSLSLCIYLGTYLILLSPTILVLRSIIRINNDSIKDLICGTNGLFLFVGTDLVVATAFVKTLRIWHIFHYFGKLKKHWSDSRLLLIILVIIVMAMFLYFLQMSTGNCHSEDKLIFQKQNGVVQPYYALTQLCNCDQSVWWMAGSLIYTVTLMVLLFTAAIKTRKIPRKNFKDTKKIILLICCCFVLGTTLLCMWLVFHKNGQYIASFVSIVFCYSLMSFFIQVFLFLPKVLPPLYRKIVSILKN